MIQIFRKILYFTEKIIWRFILVGRPKIFVISFQRTGTTSTGIFFKDHGFRVATYGVSKKNKWTLNWFKGDFKKIFSSIDFKSSQVFEDDPWWCGDFYKYLFHRFPTSKFILLERDPDKWVNSMVSHSNGKNPGNTYLHAKLYGRMKEYYQGNFPIENKFSPVIDNLLPLNETYRDHYKNVYKEKNQEIKDFFQEFSEDRFYFSSLDNKNKWVEIGKFIGFKVDIKYEVHANKSKK